MAKSTNQTVEKKLPEVVKEVKNDSDIVLKNLQEKNDLLNAQLEAMKAQMELLMKAVANNATASTPDSDVLVISLCNNMLNLSTEPHGAGDIYTFESLGQEQMIPRDDLKKIIRSHSTFARQGLFYIADKDFVEKEKLSGVYSKILDLDSLISLLDCESDKFRKIFEALPDAQKETFVDIISKKLIHKEKVDMNIVDICSEVLNRDIKEEVKQAQSLLVG